MSKKKFINRLENLFAEMEQEATFLPTSGTQSLPGWTWECDADGSYTVCSSEVEALLGIRPQDFLGQGLAGFALDPGSAILVKSTLKNGETLTTLNVNYKHQTGELIQASLHILSTPSEDNGRAGYHGFVQVLQTSSKKPGIEDKPPTEPKTSLPDDIIHFDQTTLEISRLAPPLSPVLPTERKNLRKDRIISQPAITEGPGAIIIPVRLQEGLFGSIEIADDTPERYWNTDERRLVEQVADQLSLALENAYLFQNEQRRANELNTLVELSRLISQNLDLDEVYTTAHRIIGQLMPTESFFINLIDRQRNEFIAAYGVERGIRQPVDRYPLNAGVTGQVTNSGNPLIILDIKVEKNSFARISSTGSTQDSGSIIAVPLRFSDEIIGVLSTQSYQPDAFNDYDLGLLQTFADHIAIAIQNAHLYQEEQRRRQIADTLREIASVIGSTLDLEALIERLLDQLAYLIPFQAATIHLVHNAQRRLIGWRGIDEMGSMQASLGQWTPIDEDPLIAAVVQSKQPTHLSDTHVDPRWVFHKDNTMVRSWIAAPLVAGQEVVGILTLNHPQPGTYTIETAELASAVAAQAAVAIQNANLFEQTQSALSETETLYQASAELNTSQSYENILEALRNHSIAGIGSNFVSLSLFDRPWTEKSTPEWVTVSAHWSTLDPDNDIPSYPIQAFPSLTELLKPDSILIIENVRNDPRLDNNLRTLYIQRYQAASTIFVPLVATGQWIGFINVTYEQRTTFLDAETRRLMALAGQAAVAAQNLHSITVAEQRAREAQQRSEELALINRLVSAMISSPDFRQVLDAVANELLTVFKLGHVGIALLNKDRTSLTVVAEKSSASDPSAVGMRIPVKGNPSTEQVISTRKPLVIPDAQNNPLLAPVNELMKWRKVESITILPLITGGEVIGTLGLDILEKGRIFTARELTLAETLVGQISTAIQNVNLYEQTQKALAETEILYQASAELNAVQTNFDILSILRKSTVLGHPDARHVTINIFDRPWNETGSPLWYITIARWSKIYSTGNLSSRHPMSDWVAGSHLLNPDGLMLIPDAANEPLLDEVTRSIYVEQLGARGLLFAPLVVGGQWIGFLDAVYTQLISFSDEDTRPLMTLTGQAAVAIQNLRLFDETRRRAAQLETAAEIARDTSSTLALEALLKRSVNLIRDRYGYYHASIYLVDDTGSKAVVRESTGLAGEDLKTKGHNLPVGSQTVVGHVTKMGTPLVINNVSQNPFYMPNPLLPDTRAELAIPLKIGTRIIGALDVQAVEYEAFSSDDVAVLQTLADQIGVAVDNARSYETAQTAVEETRQRVQELSVLYDFTQSLANAPMESVEIAKIVGQHFVEVLNVSQCSISLLKVGEDDLITLIDVIHEKEGNTILTHDDGKKVIRLSDYPTLAKTLQTMQPLMVYASDKHTEPSLLTHLREYGLTSLVILPLAVKGQAFGLIELKARDQSPEFTTGQINLAMTLANASAVALENARLYEEQLQTAEKLREVDKLKSQFLANMSHELRTPLNSIIGFSRVILKGIDGPTTDLQHQDLTAINTSGQHLLNLINDILDISKIEAGKMELAFEDNINLADLINSTMSTAVGLTKDKPIKLERIIQPDLPTVRADPTRIRQVLINFLSNAAKFTEQGTITVKACVQPDPDGRPEVMVSVTDTGIGITPEDQAKLFQPFSQVDTSPTRKTGGSGLGLSISRLLIDMHSGRIGVNSELGKGSTFFFTFPIPAVQPQPEIGDQKIILTIDDDRQVISLYERYLKEHGYQVIPLTDPAQAVVRARETLPYAITLDIMMPGRNGWQVLKELKADPLIHNIPVIICSIIEDQAKGFSLGAADYLTKPILEEDLIGALNRLNGDGSIQDVLVVDDDPDDLRLIQKILLKNSQFQVRLAQGGPAGLAAIHSKPPHAVILDLFMPELDGFTLLETMRANPAFRDIPVIIFTAGDLTEEQQQRLAEFSKMMLHKGLIREEELLSSIEHTLKRFYPTHEDND